MHPEEAGREVADWIHLAKIKGQRHSLVNIVMCYNDYRRGLEW
jgi:hypothetical protein